MTSSFVGDSFFGLDLGKVKKRLMGFRRSISKRILLLDFDATSLTFAEARVTEDVVSFSHVRRFPLPEDALERGLPADPKKMAGLIQSYCQESDIPAHRAAVVIPHDAVFTAVISLPCSVASQSALSYVLDPASQAQVPVQLDQMDADLIPLGLPGKRPDTQSYFLIAIPRKLVDRVVDMLRIADMDLVKLQAGISSQIYHYRPLLDALQPDSMLLHLDLQSECTLATLLISAGPLRLSRLTSIRDFPDQPDLDQAVDSSPASNRADEVVKGDDYLPISELDLRRLVQEIRQFLKGALEQYPELQVANILLSGINSAHPMIDQLIQEMLGIQVQVLRPLATDGVGQFLPDHSIALQRLSRLIGLGVSFVSPVPATSVDAKSAQIIQSESFNSFDTEPELVYEQSQDNEQVYLLQTDKESPEPLPRQIHRPIDQELVEAPGFTSSSPLEDEAQLEVTSSLNGPDSLDTADVLNPQTQPNPLDEVGMGYSLSPSLNSGEDNDTESFSEPNNILENQPVDLIPDSSPACVSVSIEQSSSSIFSTDEPDVEPLEGSLGNDGFSLADTSHVIHLEEDLDEVPFCMDDLLDSFEMNYSPVDLPNVEADHSSDPAKQQLVKADLLGDDPESWPSIAKAGLSDNLLNEEDDHDPT